jgi:penicillin amidase
MFKKIGYFLLFFVLVLGIVSFIFVQKNKPIYKGSIDIKGLGEEVSVYFDTYGVPHIFADNEEDAYKALGYVHAQDRL